ncbi:hypothetical protein BGZ51_009279 [Haplosporangium sp. Z 767]|nr:hypothetical protein BGZ51_009279 [Haplosporangium sp. Z 767]
MSWKSRLLNLPFPTYFGTIEHPQEIDLISFLRTCATSSSSKRDLHRRWRVSILPALSESECLILRETGNRLTKRLAADLKSAEVTHFWQEMEQKEARNQHLRSLHIEVYKRETAVAHVHTNDVLLDLDTETGRGLAVLNNSSQQLADPDCSQENRAPLRSLNRPKTSSAEVAPDLEGVSAPDQERPTKKVAFRDDVFSESGSDYVGPDPPSARSSLNSIDFKYIDHLIGPGTTSSRLNTSSRCIVGGTDVSEVMMNARRDNLKKQSEITDVSDLLTINFIFDANFLRKHLPTAISESLLNVILPKPTACETALLMDFSIFAATHSYQEAKRHLRNRIQEKEDCIVTAVLLPYTERPGLWKQVSSHPASLPSLAQNEDTYTQSVVKSIIFGIIGDLDVVDHWSRDPLPTLRGFEELYFPDYFAEFDNLPLFVVEIKKPGAMDDDLEGDQRKLPCMMKLVLDTILNAGVLAPSVIGLLIRGSRCEVSSISLDNEALYIHRLIGVFELPKNNLQLGLLCPAVGLLKFARNVVVQTTNSIIARRGGKNSGKSKKDRWRRPSYYVKGNRIPMSKATAGQEDVTTDEVLV